MAATSSGAKAGSSSPTVIGSCVGPCCLPPLFGDGRAPPCPLVAASVCRESSSPDKCAGKDHPPQSGSRAFTPATTAPPYSRRPTVSTRPTGSSCPAKSTAINGVYHVGNSQSLDENSCSGATARPALLGNGSLHDSPGASVSPALHGRSDPSSSGTALVESTSLATRLRTTSTHSRAEKLLSILCERGSTAAASSSAKPTFAPTPTFPSAAEGFAGSRSSGGRGLERQALAGADGCCSGGPAPDGSQSSFVLPIDSDPDPESPSAEVSALCRVGTSRRVGESRLVGVSGHLGVHSASMPPTGNIPTTSSKVSSASRSRGMNERFLFSWNVNPLRLLSGAVDHEPEVMQKISFEDDSLLRGSRCSAVLQHVGRLLNDSAGNQETYLKSAPVLKINTFISHNWSTPRSTKFQVLALTFHFDRAVAMVSLYSLVVLSLEATGRLPFLQLYAYDLQGTPRKWGPYACAGGPVVFLACLFGWQELGIFFPCWDKTVFLDKTCIHQTDENRKIQGVHSLGAFIRHSQKMVVVYTEMYLKKLWTVYELASFLCIHQRGNLEVVPVFLPKLLVVSLIGYTCFHLLVVLAHQRNVIDWIYCEHQDWRGYHSYMYVGVVYLVGWPMTSGLAVFYRQWHLDQKRFAAHCEEFSVANARCFDENDRPVVQQGIHIFMRAVGRVSPHADEETALKAFNKTVRRELPLALQNSIGGIGMTYKHAWTVFLAAGLMAVDELGAGISEGLPGDRLILDFSREVLKHVAICPLLLAVMSVVMKQTVCWETPNVYVYLLYFIVGFIGVSVSVVPLVFVDRAKRKAYDSIVWFCIFWGLCTQWSLIAACVWIPLVREWVANRFCCGRCASANYELTTVRKPSEKNLRQDSVG